jgi:ABC-type sulfate transport system permease subunit
VGKIIDRDKNKRKIFPIKSVLEQASVNKLDAYAKRIARAEKLNIILLTIVIGLIILNLGVIVYGN